MGGTAAEADRTLFVGNLDPKVTEELIFELFHQAGPVIKVKIPKDKDGKQKQFAFVSFKHEESVPYGMNLLNGIKLYGRPINIQFRSGSSHASQDSNSSCLPHGAASLGPSGTPHLASRHDRNTDSMVAAGFPSMHRSLPSHDNLQRQAGMHGAVWQQSQPGFAVPGYQHGHSLGHPSASHMLRRPDVAALRKSRMGSHPYYPDSRHLGREQRAGDRGSDYGRGKRDDYGFEDRGHISEHHYRGSRDEPFYDDRNRSAWSHDYDSRRESYREGSWRLTRH
ncbi:RNA-binding protein 7 [Gallus gallus]|uniref:RNA-binding protein 7 n=1 Tax=Gallus gallus TaxID=9031 RepID=F1NGK7_CHICK|nr:RNA-binding protein 7 [Gallus gallus]